MRRDGGFWHRSRTRETSEETNHRPLDESRRFRRRRARGEAREPPLLLRHRSPHFQSRCVSSSSSSKSEGFGANSTSKKFQFVVLENEGVDIKNQNDDFSSHFFLEIVLENERKANFLSTPSFFVLPSFLHKKKAPNRSTFDIKHKHHGQGTNDANTLSMVARVFLILSRALGKKKDARG